MSTKSVVNKWLRARLMYYGIFSATIACFVVYNIIKDPPSLALSLTGLGMGCLIGIGFSRISKISWDTDGDEVISRLDVYGGLLLTVYIAFEIYRNTIVSYFVSGPSVAATSLAALAGILFGRVIGMRRKIRTVLQENV